MAVGKAITVLGEEEVVKLFSGSGTAFTQLRFGGGTTTPTKDDTALESPLLTKTATVTRNGSDLEFAVTIAAGEISGTIYEWGIFNPNNVMYCREVGSGVTITAENGATFTVPAYFRRSG